MLPECIKRFFALFPTTLKKIITKIDLSDSLTKRKCVKIPNVPKTVVVLSYILTIIKHSLENNKFHVVTKVVQSHMLLKL